MRGRIALAGALAIAWLPAATHAADTWTEPFPGVRMLERVTATPWRIWALQIDLCESGVRLRATKSSERGRTVSSFANLVDADMVVNGDFFSFADYSTSGLAVGGGEPWADTVDSNGMGFVAFGNDRAEIKMPGSVVDPPASWMAQVVSGRRKLVDAGVPLAQNTDELCSVRHPRTVAGVSEDGRMLVLAVVDGRTQLSVGMTCTELGALMDELGAHFAINLDGGGSTAMFVRGDSIVNDPSDGSERVVANHLGVFASGLADPGSCDRSLEEAAIHGDAYDASTTSDVDGDGDPDVCARAGAGIRCVLADDGGFAQEIVGPALSNDAGWDDAANYSTLRMGDLDGDGDADLCGRGDDGVTCWPSDGDGFGNPFVGPELSDALGWAAPRYHGTLRMADVDGDGRDDLCARSASDFRCWRSLSAGFADPFTLPDLADDAGFAEASRWGTIRMADLDADARDDLCARTDGGMRCWPSTGEGFGAPIEGPAWSDAAGWVRPETWGTIRLVDVDGDRRADLCARGSDGFRCHLGDGTGFGAALAGPAWSDNSGWADYDNHSTIRMADFDGDGALDVCGRANAGIRCHPWTGAGFGEAVAGPELSDDSGWNAIRFYSTLRMPDFDADGRADLCARSSAGITCWPSLGDGFGAEIAGPAWSDEAGWGEPEHYETVRLVRPVRRCVITETCDGVDDDCDGEVDEGCASDDTGGAEGGAEGEDGTGSGGTDPPVTDGLPDGFGEDDGGGCGCTQTPRPPLAIAGLLLFARRRRAHPSQPRSRKSASASASVSSKGR